MKLFLAIIVITLTALPARAGESFDPEQPFRQAWSHHFLQSLLDLAKEAIEDHFEISGEVESGKNGGESKRSLGFKFYPEGKSKSDEHFSAEGWFGPSSDSALEELHLRFALPKRSDSSRPLPDNVL